MKYYSKLSVSNICHTEIIICNRKFTIVNILDVSKILAEFSKVFNFEKSLIYALPKFNRNLMSAGCCLYFSIGNLTWNVYNGKFFDVSNEDILTNARN